MLSQLAELERRRRYLRMPFHVLAERSGVSKATVERVLSGNSPGTSFDAVEAIARALGADLKIDFVVAADDLLREQAVTKAAEIVAITEGSTAMEAQSISIPTVQATTSATVQRLLDGPRQTLWAR